MRNVYGPVTVVNRFTIGQDAEEVERELSRTADFLRRQPGFDFLVRARLADQRDVCLQLGYWRAHADFVDAVRRRTFAVQVEKLGALILDTQADQAVSVARVIPPSCHASQEAVGVLTEYMLCGDAHAFEREMIGQARLLLTRPGFGGIDLLRSIVRPLRYLSMSWWYVGEGVDVAALTEPAGATGAAVRVERTQQIAYQRAVRAG